MSHVWDFQTVFASWPLLSQGLLNTLKLGLLTLITGLFFGLFVGLGRYSRNRWVNFPASVFVEVFRNTRHLSRSCGSTLPFRSFLHSILMRFQQQLWDWG